MKLFLLTSPLSLATSLSLLPTSTVPQFHILGAAPLVGGPTLLGQGTWQFSMEQLGSPLNPDSS